MRVSFFGAAGTVTGSRFLIEAGSDRVLVDCGLFQGLKILRERNWAPFPVEPASIDAVVLTHAHLDHSGYLPVLAREGFRGPIHCTPPTAELTPILLADSGRLQEEDARYANRKGFSRHRPALPLYTEEDAGRVSEWLIPRELEADFTIGTLTLTFRSSGHILGAAGVHVRGDGVTITFSGDIGRPADPLIPAPAPPPPSDFLVMESTYGDRAHSPHDPSHELAKALKRTISRGGVMLVPAFAVGRAQLLLYLIQQLFEAGTVPEVPVFLNSPMAIDVTKLYYSHATYHRLSTEACAGAFRSVNVIRSVEESKALNQRRGPMVIVAGAGMLTGGRILHHLKAFGDDPRNTILLAGYQAPGTRGADLIAGARSLKIHGFQVAIRAEVVRLEGLSAHAGQDELLAWLGASSEKPRGVYLVHGEPVAADALRRCIEDSLRTTARAAQHLETVELLGRQPASREPRLPFAH